MHDINNSGCFCDTMALPKNSFTFSSSWIQWLLLWMSYDFVGNQSYAFSSICKYQKEVSFHPLQGHIGGKGMIGINDPRYWTSIWPSVFHFWHVNIFCPEISDNGTAFAILPPCKRKTEEVFIADKFLDLSTASLSASVKLHFSPDFCNSTWIQNHDDAAVTQNGV